MARELSIAQLESMLNKRKVQLERLLRKRAKMQKTLSRLDGRIESVGGAPERAEKRSRRSRRRAANARSLIHIVTDILNQNKKGLKVAELSEKVLAAGYKTTSSNFKNTLYQCLYNNTDKLAHDTKAHIWRLK